MSSLEQAVETQLRNIQVKTGKTLAELADLVRQSGLTKQSEIRDMLKRELGLGHGDANSLVHAVLQSDGEGAAQAKGATTTDVVDELYTGAKAHPRPIHNRLMTAIEPLGSFEIAPKKGYINLRRKKQFVMTGPATNTRVEVGLNMKGVEASERLTAMPAGSMCNYKVKVTNAAEVDDELVAWIKQAFASVE
jgi:hypothetical protein